MAATAVADVVVTGPVNAAVTAAEVVVAGGRGVAVPPL